MAKSAARQKFKVARSLEPDRFALGFAVFTGPEGMLSPPGDPHLLLVPYYAAVQDLRRCQNIITQRQSRVNTLRGIVSYLRSYEK
jgi:hypothetical protein